MVMLEEVWKNIIGFLEKSWVKVQNQVLIIWEEKELMFGSWTTDAIKILASWQSSNSYYVFAVPDK